MLDVHSNTSPEGRSPPSGMASITVSLGYTGDVDQVTGVDVDMDNSHVKANIPRIMNE